MASTSVHRTTRHHRVDHDFLDLLEEDFGIPAYALRNAFLGVPTAPKREAIALCEWAVRADSPARALLAWARKNGAVRSALARMTPPATSCSAVVAMCRKYQRRCPVLLAMREEALQEWCRAETQHAVWVAWGRLGGKVTLHRYGPQHFSELAKLRRRRPIAPLR